MKQFSCGDIVPGCGRVMRGTESQILAAATGHAQAEHGLTEPEMPPSLISAIRKHMIPA